MFEKGDIVECINALTADYITAGSCYKVLTSWESLGKDNFIDITDDNGDVVSVYAFRFKLVEEKEVSVKEQIEKLKKDLELLEKKYQEELEGPEPAPGQLWQDLDKGYEHAVYIVNSERILVDVRTGGFYSSSSTFGQQGKKMFKYLGMSEDLISIKGM